MLMMKTNENLTN